MKEWHPSAVGYNFRRPICANGHDKRIVGVQKSGKFCAACASAARSKKNREAQLEKGGKTNPAYVPALRYYRTHAGISQERLAEALGMSPWHLLDLEKGRHRAFLCTRRKLAEALGVRPGDLMVPPPGPPKELRTNHMKKKAEEVAA